MYLKPRYWAIYLLFAFMRLQVLLPYRWQLGLGRLIGRISYYFAPYRRRVAAINLKLCFPNMTEEKRRLLLKQNFADVGMGIVEIAMSWWLPEKRVHKLATWHGEVYLDEALATKRPIILAGAHYTCLEMAARLFAQSYAYQIMHRPHKNPLFNELMTVKRSNHAVNVMTRDDIRGTLKAIQSGIPMWYAPDQDYGRDVSVFVPFFGVSAASITVLSRLAKRTNAIVLPLIYHRNPDYSGYSFHIYPPLENYPSDDLSADAAQYNQLLEADLRVFPEQYLWQHRRFKTRPIGEAKIYPSKPRRVRHIAQTIQK